VLFALLTPIGLAGKSMLSRPESQVQPAEAVAVGEFKETPDVLILVFDALGSSTVLERFYDYDSTYLDRFRTAGLGVSDSMTANYNFTHLSLASFYRMDYPLLEGQSAGDAEWADLLRAIRGDNPLVDAFQSQGYRFLMVESSWSGSQCSRDVDICIRGVWPDTPTATAVRRSLFGALPIPKLSEAEAPANLNSIAWLESDLESYLSNDLPEIMFVHLFLPHAPLRLDSNCEYRSDGGLGHMAVVAPVHSASDAEIRKRLYVDQVRCAERVIREVAELVGDGAILIVFGDHGPDSQRQSYVAPEAWSDSDIEERFRVFFATNATECGLLDVASLVNVGRALLSCLSGSPPTLADDRYFIASLDRTPLREIRLESGVRP
jgi:hypothetical protein